MRDQFDGCGIPFHPLSNIFPLMSEDQLAELAADIKKNGQLEPITRFEGQILDGRNRYKACLMIRRKPDVADYLGKDPVGFVISANVHRRHLTPAQKDEIIGKLLTEHSDWSDRTIGKVAKADHKTVGRRRAEREGRGEIPHVERRADSKGRSFPAPKPREAKASAATPATEPPVESEAQRDAKTVMAFARLLHEDEIGRQLNELLRLLRDEKQRIAELAKEERESLARGFLGLLQISADDLRPVISVPAMESAFGTVNGEMSLPELQVRDDLARVLEMSPEALS
jgi:hypothetical protein